MSAQLSAVWFPARQRLFSTMVGVTMQFFGLVFGYFMASWIVTDEPLDSPIFLKVNKARNDLRS